jgi:hypothetical protein
MARSHLVSITALASLLQLLCGCGLELTSEPPPFESLEPPEQQIVRSVVEELAGFDAALVGLQQTSISAIVDPARINVAHQHKILIANVGEDRVHLGLWQSLREDQQQLIQTWFDLPTRAATERAFERFFYRFMVLVQGARQYAFEAMPAELLRDKAVYTIDRHATRAAVSYLRSRKLEPLHQQVRALCKPLLERYRSTWGQHVNQPYMSDNLGALTDPNDPTGYFFFVCSWLEMAQTEAQGLAEDLRWLRS